MKEEKRSIVWVEPKTLKPHVRNDYIYHDHPNEEFIESIRECGIHTPLIVEKSKKTIISGHKRHAAAMELGLELVPVDFRTGLYEDEVLRMLVETNRQRSVRTPETIAREIATLVDAESKRRHRLAREAKEQGKAAPEFAETAREVAASEAGVSTRTVNRAMTVEKALSDAEASGDTERAGAIRQGLEKSITAAERVVAPPKPKKKYPPKEPDAFADKTPARDWLTDCLKGIVEQVDRLVEGERRHGGPSVHSARTAKTFAKGLKELQDWIDDLI